MYRNCEGIQSDWFLHPTVRQTRTGQQGSSGHKHVKQTDDSDSQNEVETRVPEQAVDVRLVVQNLLLYVMIPKWCIGTIVS